MIDKSENNLIDEQESQQLSHNKPPKPRGAGFALFIASLALFFTAAGIAAGYKHWQRMSDRAKGNARKIEAIETALPTKVESPTLEKLNTEISERIDKHQAVANKQLRDMAEMQTQTSQFAETVTSQVERITSMQAQLQQEVSPKSGQEWQVAEVAFLLRLAERELNLSTNRESALGALKAADQRISEIAGTNYLPVRQQISRDITALEAMNIIDIAALSGKIDSILRELQPASGDAVAEKSNIVNATDDVAEVGGNASLWSDYKQKTLDAINKAVVVRRIDSPLAATLDAESQQQLLQLLQLRLENLRLMALQKNNRAYQAQITLLRTTFADYYSPEQAAVWLAPMDELAAINLQIERPDISGSLRQLEQARQISMAKGKQ